MKQEKKPQCEFLHGHDFFPMEDLRGIRRKLTLKMRLAYQVLAGSLLISIVSTKGADPEHKVVWGTLGHDFELNISNFQMNDNIDDIRWEKGKTKVARLKGGKLKEAFERCNVSTNGALRIQQLKTEDHDTYKVTIYDTNGKNVLDETFRLIIQEEVSEPVMSWTCTNKSLTCEIRSGTDPELMLYLDNRPIDNAVAKTISRKIAMNRWTTKRSMLFNCTAKNKVSEQSRTVTINCSEKGLDIYLIIGICGGGFIFLVFVILLIFYINKRKKQNDEELEVRTCRVTSKERRQKPRQVPGAAPQNPAMCQPPPPPSHRPQAPCPRPPPPSHRVHHHPQKKAPPASATQVHQQKGPPLPRPRVQPKPPHGATENS
ncbi:T-cell surface antigen CD2 isoform X2 [Meles meles]|uniref:T-cell surface antigen CD2 isoform X2 n=1 Tax=Meles meles TaxID=9662 RepID=UPI001E69A5E5|nr:T-cell surface antigen CD2 isoform X2 [Meles meles]